MPRINAHSKTPNAPQGFAGRGAPSPEELLPLDGTNLRVEWKAPTDSVYVERMYLPLDRGKKSYFSAQVYESFKADWTPAMPGLWTLTLRPEDRSEVLPLRGMGLVVTRKY